jgi:hypothetical protein
VNSTAYLEPPMSLILGDSGGQGLISSALDEIFKCKSKYLGSTNPPHQPPHKLYSGSVTPIRSQSSGRVGVRGRAETGAGGGYLSNDYVLFSAVMICEGQVMDLLGPSSSTTSSTRTRISQRSDGSYSIHHATKLQLRSVSDFERIAGVLLGRRAALREVTSLLFQMNSSSSPSSSASLSPAEMLSAHHENISVADMPWLLASENEACILFTLTTTGEGVSMSSHGAVNYYFTCPCGKYWSLPGSPPSHPPVPHPDSPQEVRSVFLLKLSLVCLTPLPLPSIRLERSPNFLWYFFPASYPPLLCSFSTGPSRPGHGLRHRGVSGEPEKGRWREDGTESQS